ncbi:MAG: hypothetical protein IT204_07530 [Fimbriimonadaceae bacterium]|nr:hypothetical protein [Fimbriimonadaceae bacterium]
MIRKSFDGSQYREYDSQAGNVVRWVQTSAPEASTFLDYARWKERRLPSEGLLAVGDGVVVAEIVGDWSCLRVDAPRIDGGVSSWWVCPALDYLVVKAWHRWPVGDGSARRGSGYRVMDSVQLHGDRWVPMQQRILTGVLGEDDRFELWEAQRFTTIEWHENDDAHDILLAWLGWTTGMEYNDGSNERHLLGGDPWLFLERLRNGVDAGLRALQPQTDGAQP